MILVASLLATLCGEGLVRAEESQALPALSELAVTGAPSGGQYVDPEQLRVPWPRASLTRVPWRGYLETRPATAYLYGLGVVWGRDVPGKSPDEVAAMLADAGFSRVRMEIGWGKVEWEEHGLREREKLEARIRSLARNGLRPLILLNANHQLPTPYRPREAVVGEDAAKGATRLHLEGDLRGLPPWRTFAGSLAGRHGPGPLLTEIDAVTGWVTLSRPLEREVRKGEKLRLLELKYDPLYPTGTPQFERTAAGWERYVQLVTDLVARAYGKDDFDIEVWNELTFGSAFLSINNYTYPYKAAEFKVDFLHPGGQAWELARRTVDVVRARHPGAKVIWGFSNTTFFHVPPEELPPGIDGQSYHPYGVGRRCFGPWKESWVRSYPHADGPAPDTCFVMPEGWAHTYQQTESLMRLLPPGARTRRPPGTVYFQHFMTEHGFAPAELDLSDTEEILRAKAKFLLRAPVFWLNKGIDAIYVHQAYEPLDTGMGFLRADGSPGPALEALRRMTGAFAGAEPLDTVRQLGVELRALGTPRFIIPPRAEADGVRYGSLAHRDVVAVLPFQVNDHRFVIPMYVMTTDFPADLPPEPYEITLSNLDGTRARVTYYDPLEDVWEPVEVVGRTPGSLTVRLWATDVPRLLIVDGA